MGQVEHNWQYYNKSNPRVSIITLNVNSLNILIKK